MPYYANLPRYQEPSPEEKSDRLLGHVAGAVGGYQKLKAMEQAKATIADPKSTPIQKAMALASIGQEKLGQEVYKKSANETLIGGIEERLNQRLGRGGKSPNVPGATPGINPYAGQENVAPTVTQPGAEGTPTQRPFTINGPANASRNVTARMMQGVDPNYNPYIQQQNAPNPQTTIGNDLQNNAPLPQIDPLQQLASEADAYDDAASEAAKIGNVALQRDYQEKANQRREDIRQKQQFNQKLQVKDIDAIRKDIQPYTNTEELSKNVKDLERVVKLIDSGKVSLDDNYMRNFVGSLLGDSKYPVLQELLKTPEQQELFSLTRKSLKPKQEGGSNPSTKEVLLSTSAIPNPYKGKRANRFIAENLLNEAIIQEEKSKAMKRFAKEKGISYEQWMEKVDNFIAPMKEQLDNKLQRKYKLENAKEKIAGRSPKSGKVFVMSPEGAVGEIDTSQLDAAINSGGELIR